MKKLIMFLSKTKRLSFLFPKYKNSKNQMKSTKLQTDKSL